MKPHPIEIFAAALLLTTGACAPKDSDPDNPAALPAAGTGGGPAGSGGVAAASNAGRGGGALPAGSGGAGAGATGNGGMQGAAGSGGAASIPVATGGTGAVDAGLGDAPALKPKCKRSPEQVIVMGDSYLNWITHTFPDDIIRESGETWRMYALGGCSLGSGGLCLIPDQLDQALADDPDIIAGVMTGGGNDILIADELMFPGSGECKDREDGPSLKVCQDVVATAIAAGDALMAKAAGAGIRDVIYLFYPHIPGGGFGGEHPNFMLDYALPRARELCDGAEQRTEGKLRCHFVDLVPLFEGHADWFADDGIHENELGSAAMAKKVVEVAAELCIAQPESSGCCEP
jgi:hypothetical protein